MISSTDQLAQAAVADSQAFAALYDRFFARVYNYMRYRCNDADEADDLTAQVFERLFERLPLYQPERGAFEPWLFTIARNALTDHLRKQRRAWLFWQEQIRHPEVDPSPENSLIEREATQRLAAALKRLDERSRELVSLKFFARLSNRQIAEAMRLTESNVGVILYRAMAQLRTIITSAERSIELQGVKK
jgi:RNA polymerase sigma-70 factor (ECF subfamily)